MDEIINIGYRLEKKQRLQRLPGRTN